MLQKKKKKKFHKMEGRRTTILNQFEGNIVSIQSDLSQGITGITQTSILLIFSLINLCRDKPAPFL